MLFRSLIVGSAVLLAGGVAARAGELPVPDTGQYARICSVFGEGFYFIPGTDTCLKIGGEVRAEMHVVDGDVALFFGGPSDDEFNNWTTRARANARFDARTASSLGLIRTFIDFEATVGPADFDVNYDGSDFELKEAYVQVAGAYGTFTAGHTASFFDFFSSDTFGTRLDIDDNTTEQTLFAYTMEANGLRGTLSVEDPASSGRRLNGTDDYEGQQAPDVVANVGIERDWGSAQLMGVLRHINDDDGDGLGWAVGAGFTATLPVLDIGVGLQAAYADGAIAYVTNDPGGLGDFAGPDGDDTNQAWGVRAGLTAPVASSVDAWLDGSFTHVETGDGADEYDFWAIVAGAAWQATDTLLMGPEVAYNRIEGDDPGETGEVWGGMWRVAGEF